MVLCVGANDGAIVVDSNSSSSNNSKGSHANSKRNNGIGIGNDDSDSDDEDEPPALGPPAAAAPLKEPEKVVGHCRTTFGEFDTNLLALVEKIRGAINAEVNERLCWLLAWSMCVNWVVLGVAFIYFVDALALAH